MEKSSCYSQMLKQVLTLEQSKSYKLPPEPDQGFDGRKTNSYLDNTIDMGR